MVFKNLKRDESTEDVTHMLHHIADALHAKDKILILVIPPKRESWSGPAGFSEENFKKLYQVVDFFSLMTYDYKLVAFLSNYD